MKYSKKVQKENALKKMLWP